MEQRPSNERLASLEAKVEILLDLLKEIRDDLKNNPSKEEFVTLQDRVKVLEDRANQSIAKLASTAGVVSVLSSILTAIVAHYIMK